MQDTGPPTELGEVVVTGQRRRSDGTFPPASGGGGYAEPPEGPVPIQVGDDPPPDLPPDPCSQPETALEWNADAAAAEAMRKFRLKAAVLGDDDLYQREFHAFLYRDDAGRIQVGEVTPGNRVGSTEESTVDRNWAGITPDNLIGSIHSHPGGSVAPSGTDWNGFEIIRGWVNEFAGAQRASEYRQYIVARNVTDPESQFLPRIYNETSPRTDDAGPEVNPDALPCP